MVVLLPYVDKQPANRFIVESERLIAEECRKRKKPHNEPITIETHKHCTRKRQMEVRTESETTLAQLENEIQDAEMQLSLGTIAWEVHAKNLEALLQNAISKRDALRQQANLINQQRKSQQIATKKQLDILETTWNEKINVLQQLRATGISNEVDNKHGPKSPPK